MLCVMCVDSIVYIHPDIQHPAARETVTERGAQPGAGAVSRQQAGAIYRIANLESVRNCDPEGSKTAY